MAKTKLPISRAKTAYGLLSEIAALAIAEPKRMRMSITLDVGDPDDEPDYYPACGTVGCIAGWTRTLRPHGREDRGRNTLVTSATTLGLRSDQLQELFLDDDLCSARNQQTAAHAKAVARHIRKFQQKYRHQLLAKKV